MDNKSKTGLGEFWDKWQEELEKEQKAVEALREKRKQEGTGYEDGSERSDRSI